MLAGRLRYRRAYYAPQIWGCEADGFLKLDATILGRDSRLLQFWQSLSLNVGNFGRGSLFCVRGHAVKIFGRGSPFLDKGTCRLIFGRGSPVRILEHAEIIIYTVQISTAF